MLKTTLLHPEILYALGSAGHGAQVLISDGNYPHATKSNPAAERVFGYVPPLQSTTRTDRPRLGRQVQGAPRARTRPWSGRLAYTATCAPRNWRLRARQSTILRRAT